MVGSEIALVTFAHDYAGPGTIDVLREQGFVVVAHDLRFHDPARREEFERRHPRCHAMAGIEPADAVARTLERFGRIDAYVSNDTPLELSQGEVRPVDRANFSAMTEALLLRPERALRRVIAAMLASGAGRIVMVTSGAADKFPHRSSDGNTGYLAARAAANALARTLAVQHAPDNIQINVVAPFYLYSERVFPAPGGENDPANRARLARDVPAGRFGRDDEIGALIAFLLSGKSPFTTGQTIAFSGAGA